MSKHTNETPVCEACEIKLRLAHDSLSDWFRSRVKPNYPTCHIAWAFRDKDSQEHAFLDGKTKLHFPNSAHNKEPAEALDLFQLDEQGRALWPWKFFNGIAMDANKDGSPIFWGGQWVHLGDCDHYQLRAAKGPTQS